MRSFQRLSLIVAAFVVTSTRSAAYDAPPVDCATQAIAAVELAGDAVVDNLRMRFHERIDLRSGRYIREWSSASHGISGGEGFDGTRWWTRDVSGASHALNAPSAKALATTVAWLNRQRWCTRRGDGSVSVTPHEGAPITFAASRGRIIRTEFALPEDHEIQSFSDWRVVDGMWVPFARRVDYPEDDSHETWIVTHVRTSQTAPEQRVFASPSPPRDSGTNPDGTVTVPLHILYDKPRISVKLNGRRPFTYVLDSGGHFIATPPTARISGLAPIGSANETGEGTAILPVRFARAQRVDIGNAFMNSQTAKIVPYSAARLERAALPARPAG